MRPTPTVTLAAALAHGRAYLKDRGIDSFGLDAALLLAHAVGVPKTYLYAHPENAVAPEILAAYEDLLLRRGKREPTQYILGECEFYGLDMIVTRDVLIPRPDTETLVEAALRLIAYHGLTRGLELGTGSGCISAVLCVNSPAIHMTGVEISPAALDISRQNAARHKIADRTAFILSDLFADVALPPYDFIISNPPYIPEGELGLLDEGVRGYEPRTALNGGADGLDFYRAISREAGAFLRPGGFLLYEIGCDQRASITSILADNGFGSAHCVRDLAGRDRVVYARRHIL